MIEAALQSVVVPWCRHVGVSCGGCLRVKGPQVRTTRAAERAVCLGKKWPNGSMREHDQNIVQNPNLNVEHCAATTGKSRWLVCHTFFLFFVSALDVPLKWNLARSPLHTVAGLLAGWNLQLFVGRYLCPTLVEEWEVEGYLYGWRMSIPETAPVAPDPDPLALTYRGTATLMPSLWVLGWVFCWSLGFVVLRWVFCGRSVKAEKLSSQVSEPSQPFTTWSILVATQNTREPKTLEGRFSVQAACHHVTRYHHDRKAKKLWVPVFFVLQLGWLCSFDEEDVMLFCHFSGTFFWSCQICASNATVLALSWRRGLVPEGNLRGSQKHQHSKKGLCLPWTSWDATVVFKL